jgi:hypothetical protein
VWGVLHVTAHPDQRIAALARRQDGLVTRSIRAASPSNGTVAGMPLCRRGFSVMRVTWGQLVHEPEAVVARLAQRLSSRQWR